MKSNHFKRSLSMLLAVVMLLSCWVWVDPAQTVASAANENDSNYLFAYFTGTSIDGQTIHLAVSQDGLNYTALRNNEPVIIPSKGTGCVRDPYLWYNEQDNYYYILATDLDFTDTGSDYSDNSESFIIWRSKDLVHWYDETMIDVKAMSHLIGNTDNMQAVWAPQVLWDGESYVVYFSLQCEATKTPWGWNNLQIVYLRTTDLLDQNAYYEYGVIHDPERHVIDADIIKKPGTEQYYMFYKDESASGGIQSIYYMISDNGPTGPYYAPDNANDGRGPQLFADVGKNIEGCNSFFDDNGNLITYVDEYDYTNAAGQKEAHFHVSSSSDFKTFTKLPESSYNINTLSPRHGSVVKITDEEYNRLLNNAYGITSSSFPATESLEDHLVARYFTTSNPTENAVADKAGLSNASGISMEEEYPNVWAAYFNKGSAEVNLGELIPGDLNIKDGFTITFNALVFDSNDYNTRFFDISNNWSQRTDPSECYLHMSPIAESNGSYIGAYNGPKTTTSWTWSSIGKDYDDGEKHEYMISFADGNMIVYIDGELAMKRDRFNFNLEYGDNFIDDNWYKQIGNSTMRIGKSEWDTDPLFTGYLQDFCIYDCAMSYYDIKTIQNEQDIEAGFVNTPSAYTGFNSAVPVFPGTTVDEMKSVQNKYGNNGLHYGNVVYSSNYDGLSTPTGGTLPTANGYFSSGSKAFVTDPGETSEKRGHIGIYYAKDTVLLYDGINEVKMPVMMAGRTSTNDFAININKVYPAIGAGDHDVFGLIGVWSGHSTSNAKYHECYTNTGLGDKQIGYRSDSNGHSAPLHNDDNASADVRYYSNVLKIQNGENIDFNSDGYAKFNLDWYVVANGGSTGCDAPDHEGDEGTINATNSNIYVVNLNPYVQLRNDIADEYNGIVTNPSYCPAAIANYKSVVETVLNFNPQSQSFNYAGGTEAAVQQCIAAINKLIADYNTAEENVRKGHNQITFEGRVGNCDVDGLTPGTYCEFCGKVFEEQKAFTGHKFTEKVADSAHRKVKASYDVAGEYWYECSLCQFIAEANKPTTKDYFWVDEKIPYELSYENLFVFSDWANSVSSDVDNSKGTIAVDAFAGTITLKNYDYGDFYSSPGFANNYYNVAVTPGESYVFEYTTSGGTGDQVHIFFYDANGNGVPYMPNRGNPFANAYGNGHNTNYITFTPPEGTTRVSLRFGTTIANETVTFSNLAMYYETRIAETDVTEWTPRLYRKAYKAGELLQNYDTPSRESFSFNAWYVDVNGNGVLDSADKPLTAYLNKAIGENLLLLSTWSENFYNVTFDNMFDISKWNVKPGNDYATVGKNGNSITIVSATGAGEGYTNRSPRFSVEGLSNVNISADVTGSNFDMYMFFYDKDGNATNPAHAYINRSSGTFAVPEGAVTAELRFDANGANNTVTFSNVRVFAATGATYSGETIKTVNIGEAYGNTTATATKTGYDFAGWADKDGKLYFDANGNAVVSENITADAPRNFYSQWKLNNTSLNTDAYVLDFGLSAIFAPLDNDYTMAKDGGSYSITGLGTTITGASDSSSVAYTNSANGFSIVDGKTVKYTPAAYFSEPVTVYYQVTYTNGSVTRYLYSSITVIPATVVYYEDDVQGLVEYINGIAKTPAAGFEDSGKWNIVGETKINDVTQNVADAVYGYDEIYNNATDTYSMGSAHKVSVSQYNNPKSTYSGSDGNDWPVAQFTFAGTGFDVVSLISQNTGAIEVRVFKGADVNGDSVKQWIIDAYYGYTLEDDEWVITTNSDNALYQIPVICETELDYGTYTVQIIPTYTSVFDHQKDGAYDFYLDAIRIYNPCDGDEVIFDYTTVNDVYFNYNEFAIKNVSIRNILLEANDLDATDELSGVVYINPGKTAGTFEEYSKIGPKNEVYLAKGQSIAFNLTVSQIPSSIQISARALEVSASMRFGFDGVIYGSTPIAHKTSLYYSIPADYLNEINWEMNDEGLYTTKSPIVISNNGDGILSLCNIKATSNGISADPIMMFTMSRRSFAVAAEIAEDMSALSPEDGALFIPDSVEAETDTETVVVGGNVVVTVTTSGDVASLTVNGENADLLSENEDGTKTWRFTYAADNKGSQTITLVAYNEYGFASESTELTVDVESRFEHFFTMLKNFIMMIVDFFKSLMF